MADTGSPEPDVENSSPNRILLSLGSRRGDEGRTSRAVKVYGGHNPGSQEFGLLQVQETRYITRSLKR